jgi:hypothetical protein
MGTTRDMQALARAAADGRRSTLFLWMYQHHEEFAENVLKRAGRPNWKRIAIELAKIRWGDEEFLTTLSGKVPTGATERGGAARRDFFCCVGGERFQRHR